MSQTTYRVKGMMCGHCQKHVQETLEKIKGVEHANVLLEEGKAEVHSNDNYTLDFEEIKRAFADSNYLIEPI